MSKFLRKCTSSKFLKKCDASKFLKNCDDDEFTPVCWRTYTATFWLTPGFGCAACCGPGFRENGWTVNVEADLDIDLPWNAVGCVDFCIQEDVLPWHLVEIPDWTIIYEDAHKQIWAVAFKDTNQETCPYGPNIHADPLCSTINPHYFPEPGQLTRRDGLNPDVPCPGSYPLHGSGNPSDFGCGSP